MTDFSAFGDEAGSRLGERLRDLLQNRAGALLNDLDELWKLEVREATDDLAQLMVLQLTDSKNPVVARELAHAKARVANWTFVGADKVRDALKEVLKETLELLGSFVKGFLS